MITYSAAVVGAQALPADQRVFEQSASIVVNSIAGYRARHPGYTGSIDPTWPLADQSAVTLEANGAAVTLSTVAQSGYAPGGIVRMGPVADPLDAQKRAWIFRHRQGDAQDSGGSYRAEASIAGAGFRFEYGQRYWIAFSVLLPSAWRSVATNDEVLFFQIKHRPDVGDTNGNPVLALVARGGGVSTPDAAKLLLVSKSTPVLTSTPEDIATVVQEETGFPVDTWQHFVVDYTPGWQVSQSPRLTVWRDSGTGEQVYYHSAEPNCYNDILPPYIKHGIYYYANVWSGGYTEKVMYSKGIHIWRGTGDMDRASAFSVLHGI